MILPSAVSLMLICVSVLMRPASAGVLLRLVSSPGPGGTLVRRWTVAIILLPIALALAVNRLAVARGIVDAAFPVALLAATMAVVSFVVLVLMALPLDRVHEDVRSLLEYAPDGIFIADLDGRYSDVNEAGCRLLECSREEIVGKTILELIPRADAARLSEARESLLLGGVQVGEWTLRRKDGRYVPVEVSAKILSDGRWQGFVRDISERKRMENEQRLLYQEAQRATRVRDEVLSIVAHDLRNPLSAILIEARILEEYGHEPERRAQQPGERIRSAAKRMNRLIQDLLDVTRLEAGGLTLDRRLLPAAQVPADVLATQMGLAAAASLELRSELSTGLPDLHVDRDRLLQVFENLIGNAIKLTPAGGCITVGAGRQDDHCVLFNVTDTGPGIAVEDQPHLFDRFWQVRDRRHGAGLGLPIVKGIVEAHGGRVWVESAPGSGTTFFLTIPIA